MRHKCCKPTQAAAPQYQSMGRSPVIKCLMELALLNYCNVLRDRTAIVAQRGAVSQQQSTNLGPPLQNGSGCNSSHAQCFLGESSASNESASNERAAGLLPGELRIQIATLL